MNRQNVVVIISPIGIVEVFGNFRKACNAKGWVYSTQVKKKDWPLEIDGHKVYRLPFQ